MTIDEAISLLQRGYDRGLAGSGSTRAALTRAGKALQAVEEDREKGRANELKGVGYTLAEEAGLLLGLTTTLPREPSATGRLTPQPLTKLLHLVGRKRALEEEISQVVLDAKGTPGVTWKDIGDVLGLKKEEACARYGGFRPEPGRR